MGCNCQTCGGYDQGALLAGLMGQLSHPPLNPGDLFQFGYNVGPLSLPFRESSVSEAIENAGIAYNVRAYQLAGIINVFMAVEGNANAYFSSALDLKNALYNAISGAGLPIQQGSLQFTYASTADTSTPAPVTRTADDPGVTRDGGGGNGGGAVRCDFRQQSLPDYLACQFGIGTTGTLIVGGLAVLVAITLIKR